MDDCPDRNRLIKQWLKAVQDFSKSVSRLRVCHRDAGKFADQSRQLRSHECKRKKPT